MSGLTREFILTSIATDKKIRKFAENITRGNQLTEYLLSDLNLHFCEMEEEKLKQLFSNEQHRFWAVRFMMNQYRSKTSKFYRNFKNTKYEVHQEKYFEGDVPIILDPCMTTEYKDELDFIHNEFFPKLEHWQKQLFIELWYNQGLSGHEIHRKTGAKLTFVKESIQEIKGNIRSHLKENEFEFKYIKNKKKK